MQHQLLQDLVRVLHNGVEAEIVAVEVEEEAMIGTISIHGDVETMIEDTTTIVDDTMTEDRRRHDLMIEDGMIAETVILMMIVKWKNLSDDWSCSKSNIIDEMTTSNLKMK
jgi:hypothetical protein